MTQKNSNGNTDSSKKTTRAKSAVDALRTLILNGEFQPGDRLQGEMLAKKLGTSRTPVHSALTTLAAEGLLVHEPHCGYVVRHFDIKDVIKAIEVRMVLEALAAKNVAQKGMDERSRQFLESNLEQSYKVLFVDEWSENSQHEWFNLNRQFHDTILSLADNPYLTNLVSQVREIPNVYDHARRHLEHGDLSKLYRREQSQKALMDHKAIFEALSKGQSERAEFLLKDHIFKNREDMIENYKKIKGISSIEDVIG